MSVLEHRALELDIPVRHSSAWRVEDLRVEKFGSRFTLVADEEIPIECPLAGEHQVENARTAVAALDAVRIFRRRRSRKASRMPRGRDDWSAWLQNPDIILDGAHNPAGARALAAYIRRFFAGEPVRIIYGAMRDKAVEEVTDTLFPLAAEVILTAPDQPRALNPESLAAGVRSPESSARRETSRMRCEWLANDR